MLQAAIAFFLIGLLAMFLGANNVAGLSVELGRILLIVFVVLAVISFLVNLLRGKPSAPLSLILAAGLGLGGVAAIPVSADDTAGDKVENAGSETKTSVKKKYRAGKRHARNATGNEDKVQDAKDKVKDAEDEVENEETKVKNKVD